MVKQKAVVYLYLLLIGCLVLPPNMVFAAGAANAGKNTAPSNGYLIIEGEDEKGNSIRAVNMNTVNSKNGSAIDLDAAFRPYIPKTIGTGYTMTDFVTFSGDGGKGLFYSFSHQKQTMMMEIFDLVSKKVIWKKEIPEKRQSVQFSQDFRYYVENVADNQSILFDIAKNTSSRIQLGSNSKNTSISFADFKHNSKEMVFVKKENNSTSLLIYDIGLSKVTSIIVIGSSDIVFEQVASNGDLLYIEKGSLYSIHLPNRKKTALKANVSHALLSANMKYLVFQKPNDPALYLENRETHVTNMILVKYANKEFAHTIREWLYAEIKGNIVK